MKTELFEDWLKKCGDRNIEIGAVILFDQTFLAARYEQLAEVVTNPNYPSKKSKTKSKIFWERILCIGEVPSEYLEHDQVCFRLAGDKREWYVGGYILDRDISSRNESDHPFGATFKLAPWDGDGKIDDEGDGKYKRVKMTWLAT